MNVLTLILAIAVFMQSATTTTTTTQTARPPIDCTTPRGAAQALGVAIQSADEALLRDLMYSPDEIAGRMNDALASVLAASSRLSSAAHERFGAGGDPIASAMMPAGLLAPSTTSPVEEKGDAATITLAGTDRPLKLVRGRDGRWRIDLLGYSGVTAEHVELQAQMYRELASSLDELATDTRDGRFMSVADLKAAIQDRVHSTIAKSMRKPHPTSMPSTQGAATPR